MGNKVTENVHMADYTNTYKFIYSNYLKEKGTLAMDFPVPDYSSLIQTSTWN